MQDNNEEQSSQLPEETNTQPTHTNAEIDGIMNQIPENIPHDIKENIKQTLIHFSATSAMRVPSPFEKIVKPEHITALIENTDKDSQREFEENKENKRYLFAVFIIGLTFVVLLIFLLSDKNPELLEKLLSYTFTALLGFAGGYGLKCKSNNEQ